MPAEHGNTLAAQWAALEAAAIPRAVPRDERRDLRRCFYAGAQALIEVMKAGMSAAPGVDEQDEQLLTSLENEILAFAGDVAAGRA